ncbi:hypothetical protein NC651_036722 [Populus alba x Populus x berolinensis]|nr:hypothetical protein NC651_036722 [Populus alba x Populus x berolinensis]
MQTHLILEKTPQSIFVYFKGLFYDAGNDPKGGYYARGARAVVCENFKDNPLFDISTEHPTTYYEDMQRVVFCDDIVLPFADAIPWEEIGLFVDEKDVPNLDTILTSIPPEVILRKQRLLANGLAQKLPHDTSIYLESGEKILNWTASLVGDLKPW